MESIKSILETFPYCKKKHGNLLYVLQDLTSIYENIDISESEKKKRLTAAMVHLAWSHISTKAPSISSLAAIDDEYQYYKESIN